jgi:hypothetical protein
MRYALHLVRASRPKSPTSSEMINKYVAFGASVRAAQYLILGAKARAAMDGRAMPDMEDVAAMAQPVLSHRLVLNFQAEAEGVSTDTVIERLLEAHRLGAVRSPLGGVHTLTGEGDDEVGARRQGGAAISYIVVYRTSEGRPHVYDRQARIALVARDGAAGGSACAR